MGKLSDSRLEGEQVVQFWLYGTELTTLRGGGRRQEFDNGTVHVIDIWLLCFTWMVFPCPSDWNVGDWLYGTEDPALIPRPALHSYRLRLLHPVTRRWLDVTAPLPEDMRRLLPPDCDPA